jgi:16S rRNA (cytidine1402-2'-O)-methyltransferase
MLSYFAPREREKAKVIVERMLAGETVALVSDGGTPGVSDPGAVVVGAALEAGVRVEPVPGPSAVTAALSISPAGGGPFVFEGFLPAKAAARRKRLEELRGETRAIVFYEAPHRIAETLADLAAVLGASRRATLVREATKMFEEVVEAPLGELAVRFASGTKGEMVIVVEGGEGEAGRVTVEVGALLDLVVRAGLSPARAAKEIAAVTGVPRGRLMRELESRPGHRMQGGHRK